MDANRELDAQVATKVMGWVLSEDRAFRQWIVTAPDGTSAYRTRGAAWAPTLPAFSTDLAAAWTVVEHLRPRFVVQLTMWADHWSALTERHDQNGPVCQVRADTAPLAISLAALRAVGAWPPQKDQT